MMMSMLLLALYFVVPVTSSFTKYIWGNILIIPGLERIDKHVAKVYHFLGVASISFSKKESCI